MDEIVDVGNLGQNLRSSGLDMRVRIVHVGCIKHGPTIGALVMLESQPAYACMPASGRQFACAHSCGQGFRFGAAHPFD